MQNTPLQNFLVNLKLAWELLNIPYETMEKLQTPNEIHNWEIEIILDNWNMQKFNVYRIQHNNSRWPYKWWIRFHPEANLDEVEALAATMTIKTAVVNIPLWWAKWWVQCDPKKLSQKEIEQVARKWIQHMNDFIWVDKDIPAPDVYTNPQIMAYMMDEYEKINKRSEPWMITWKPIAIWWSLGRDTATSQWWIYLLEELIKIKNLDKSKLKVAIQWFWNAWYHAANILHNLWFLIVAVSDSKWWIYAKNWLDPQEVYKMKNKNWTIHWFYCEWTVCNDFELHKQDMKLISNEELLECDCDILIPAALDNQIRLDNADKVKASIILELANWPTTPEADKTLESKWITVIPDVIANAGWVTVSYFEWVQNKMWYYWGLHEVNEKLKHIMSNAFHEAWTMAKNKNISLRKACFIIAISRLVEAEMLRWIQS